MNKIPRVKFHDVTLFWGTIIGFVAGAIIWLFRVPKRGEDTRQDIIETGRDLIDRDPVKDSMAEGKSLAQKHRQQVSN